MLHVTLNSGSKAWKSRWDFENTKGVEMNAACRCAKSRPAFNQISGWPISWLLNLRFPILNVTLKWTLMLV